MLKKIRRMLTLQALLLGAASWFWSKKRAAIERSVRAARNAWNDPNADRGAEDDVVVAAVLLDDARTPSAADAAFAPNEPASMRPGY